MVVTADGTRTSVVIATSAEEQGGAWSPDGNSIAFSNGVGAADLYNVSILTRDGKGSPWGPPRRLSSDTGVDARWSPDGGRIVYIRRGEVHTMLRDGLDDRVIAKPSTAAKARPSIAIWSRDGQTIYFKTD